MSKINSNKDKRIEEEFNSETQKSINDVEKGIGLSKGYTNLDDMWRDLEKQKMMYHQKQKIQLIQLKIYKQIDFKVF